MVGRGLTLRAEEEGVEECLNAPSSPGKEETDREGEEEGGDGERSRTRLRGNGAGFVAGEGMSCWDVAGRGRREGEGRTEGGLETT